MRKTLSAFLFVAVIAGSVTAQAKPDFADRSSWLPSEVPFPPRPR
jgi:hypothetical protein